MKGATTSEDSAGQKTGRRGMKKWLKGGVGARSGGEKEGKRPDFLLSSPDPISRTCTTTRKAQVVEHSTNPDHRKSPTDSNVLSIFYV